MKKVTAIGGIILTASIGLYTPGFGGEADRAFTKEAAEAVLTQGINEILFLRERVIQLTASLNMQSTVIELLSNKEGAIRERRENLNLQRELLSLLMLGGSISLHRYCVNFRGFAYDARIQKLEVAWTWPGRAASDIKRTELTGGNNEIRVGCTS